MVSCPMCGKVYSEHALELHAQAEKMDATYCCPHCGWAWNPASLKNQKTAHFEAPKATPSAPAEEKKPAKAPADKALNTEEKKPAKATKAKTTAKKATEKKPAKAATTKKSAEKAPKKASAKPAVKAKKTTKAKEK